MFNKTSLFAFSRLLLRQSKSKFSNISEIREMFLEEKRYCLEDMPFKDPFKIFDMWYQEARESQEIINPNIMCLATATPNGIPSLRYMLCDSHDENSFKFFTHHTTRKGEEIVRIEGYIEKLPDETCDRLFAKRSYESQINMHCSSQTQRLKNYNILKDREKVIKKMFNASAIPRPENFGWYELLPTNFEFYQLKQKKERMKFRKLLPKETPDELTHKGDKDWFYEIMEP